MNTLEYLEQNKIKFDPIFGNLFKLHVNIASKEKALNSLGALEDSRELENLIVILTDEYDYKLLEWYESNQHYEVLAIELGLIDNFSKGTAKIQAMQYAKYSTDLKEKLNNILLVLESLDI
jgi:hypothetical protein